MLRREVIRMRKLNRRVSVWRGLLFFALGFVVGLLLFNYFIRPLLEPKDAEAKGGKVTVCHKPGEHQQTLSVDFHSVGSHLAHGDYIGRCRPWEPVCEWSEWSECKFRDEAVCGDGFQVRYLRGEGCSNEADYQKCSVSCEPEPSPSPTPTPNPPNPIGPGSFTPACYGVTHPVIPWASAERDGTDALIKYVPTTGEGDQVNVVFSENPFEIIFNLGNHGLRDWRPNNGHLNLHDLVAGRPYWFRIANGCSRWSGIFFIPGK